MRFISSVLCWVGLYSKLEEIFRGRSQAVPALATAMEVANTHYMEVVCNGALAKAKEGGHFWGQVRENNKISEWAKLFEADKLSSLVNTTAIMNIAAVVVAQKHLADINRKLTEIKQGIDAIRKHQRDERRSQLTGSIHYYEQIAPVVLSGDLSDEVLYQIEHHEADFLRIQDHVMEDIYAASGEILNLKDNEWFGSGGINQAIEDKQKTLTELYHELILCIRARACAWQLLCSFPGRDIRKMERRKHIQQSIDELTTCGDLLTKTDQFLRKKIHEVSLPWIFQSSANARKLALLHASEALLAEVSTHRIDVLKDLSAADLMLAAINRPVTMAVRIEDGRIAAIQAI